MSNIPTNMNIGLAELIKEAHISTLKAEQMGLEEYLRILGELRNMPPVSFGYSDEQGRRMLLQIPVITLIPLSLLRIEEAEFSCSCHLELKTQGEAPKVDPPSISSPEKSINPSTALTEYYDKQQNKRVYAREIHIYRSLINTSKLIFMIINEAGERSYYRSDPTKGLKDKQCVLLSMGRPYITLWKEKLTEKQISEFAWSNRPLVKLFGDGSFWYQGNTYRRTDNATKEIHIEFPLDGARYDYAHKHIAWRFLLRTMVGELERQDESKTQMQILNPDKQTEQSNFTFRVKLKQSPLPPGFADIFRVIGNSTRLSEEY